MTSQEAHLRARTIVSEILHNLLLKDSLDVGLASLHYSPTDITAIKTAIQEIANEKRSENG
jgi:hypothetical protein